MSAAAWHLTLKLWEQSILFGGSACKAQQMHRLMLQRVNNLEILFYIIISHQSSHVPIKMLGGDVEE